MAGDKTPAADRSHGGPGSAHEDAAGAHPHGKEKHVGKHGQPLPHERNASDAGTVGGGGDKDGHNSHDPKEKGKHGAR